MSGPNRPNKGNTPTKGNTPPKSNLTPKGNTPAANRPTGSNPVKTPVPNKVSSSKQAAIRKRQAQRRRNQIIIAGIAVAVIAIAVIITVVALSTPTSLTSVPGSVNQDTAFLTIGNPNAPVTLTEFADLRCIGCKSYHDQGEQSIKDQFVKTNQIQYTFKTFPVIDSARGSTDSARAGQAVYCAADQKAGWAFIDLAYDNYNLWEENNGKLTDKVLKDMASALKLDTNAFNSCLDSNKYQQRVADDKATAGTLNLPGTPSFVLSYQGKQEVIQFNNYDDLAQKIRDTVNKVGAGK